MNSSNAELIFSMSTSKVLQRVDLKFLPQLTSEILGHKCVRSLLLVTLTNSWRKILEKLDVETLCFTPITLLCVEYKYMWELGHST